MKAGNLSKCENKVRWGVGGREVIILNKVDIVEEKDG